MGWVDKKHRCDLPLTVYGKTGKVGSWFECDHCKANWQVQARVPYFSPTHTNEMWNLTFVRREGDMLYTVSWMENAG